MDRRDARGLQGAALLVGMALLLALYLQGTTRVVANSGAVALPPVSGDWLQPFWPAPGANRQATATPAAAESPPDPGSAPAPPAGPIRPSGPPAVLTSGQTLDGFPDWAPDGRRIAFMRDGRIWVMPGVGGTPQPLSPAGKLWEVAPAWSPEGGRIAVVRFGRETEVGSSLVLLDAGSGRAEEVLRLPGPVGYLAWSPEGKSLAFTADQRVAILDLATKEARTLVQVGAEVELLAGGLNWSRDGQWILYGAGEREGGSLRYQIYRVPATGGKPVALTRNGGMMPHLAPDGRRLAYRRPGPPEGIAVMDLETGEVATWARDGGGMRYFHPRWSPDGQRIIASRLTLEGKGGNVHLRSHLVVLQ